MPLTESLRFDWASLRADGRADSIPAAIEQLRDASSVEAEAADLAYYKIDGTVAGQEVLYEAAEPAIICLVSIIPDCTPVSRPLVFTLLNRLGTSVSDAEEDRSGNVGLEERCVAAVKLGTSQYFYYLVRGTLDEKMRAVPLIELCAMNDPPLTARSQWWFEYTMAHTEDPDLKRVCARSIEGLFEDESDED